MGLRASSASLMTLSYVTCVGKGWDPEGPGQAGKVGMCDPHKSHQGQVQGPARLFSLEKRISRETDLL